MLSDGSPDQNSGGGTGSSREADEEKRRKWVRPVMTYVVLEEEEKEKAFVDGCRMTVILPKIMEDEPQKTNEPWGGREYA